MDTKILLTEFRYILLEKETEVRVFFTSTEPDHPIWGNGSRWKRFPASLSIHDLTGPTSEVSRALGTLSFLTDWNK